MRGLDILVDRIRQIEAIVEDSTRRINSMVREGKVIETFPGEGKVRLEIDGMRTNKVPWATRAGDIRHWSPPKVGERVVMMSPTGEMNMGIVFPGGYSDENSENHDLDSEDMLSIGNAKIHVKDGEILLEVGGSSVRITSGDITVISAGNIHLNP